MSDGARTRDILDHNQVLYQLSYTHQGDCTAYTISGIPRPGRGDHRTCYPGVPPTTCRAAIVRSSSELRPGGSVKTASR